MNVNEGMTTDEYDTRQFKTGAAARELDLSIVQLRKWVRSGIIVAIRHPTGRLRFTGAEIRRVCRLTTPEPIETAKKAEERTTTARTI